MIRNSFRIKYIYRLRPPVEISLSVMASVTFVKELLHYSNLKTVTQIFEGKDQVEFVKEGHAALKYFSNNEDWNRAVLSGAACLFWMFGISDPGDVERTVQAFLKHGHYEGDESETVVKKVQAAIAAILKTFMKYEIQGSICHTDKITDITGRILARWAKDAPLLKVFHEDINLSHKLATISLIYNPEQIIEDFVGDDPSKTRRLYLLLMANLRQEEIEENLNDEAEKQKLKEYLTSFAIVTDIENEEMFDTVGRVEETETEAGENSIEPEDVPTAKDPNKGRQRQSRSRIVDESRRNPLGELTDREVNKGRTRGRTLRTVATGKARKTGSMTAVNGETERLPPTVRVKDILQDLKNYEKNVTSNDVIGHSYKAGKGARVFIGWNEQSPESIRWSTWVKYDPEICKENDWKTWTQLYPHHRTSLTEISKKKTDMSYQEFLDKEVQYCFRLQRGLMGNNKLAFFAQVKDGLNIKGQVISVKHMTDDEYTELKNITVVNEINVQPPKLLGTKAGQRALEAKRKFYSESDETSNENDINNQRVEDSEEL